MWKKIRRVLVNLVSIVSVCLIIASVLVLLKVITTKQGEAPNIFGYSLFRVVTGSMEPEIREDSLLVVKKTPPEDIAPGDVISFFSPDPALEGAVNTHRVMRIEKRDGDIFFVTKGDANVSEDRYFPNGELLVGKVVFCSHGLGKVVSLLSNPLVFGAVILLPLLVILLMNLFRAVRIAADIAKQEEEEAVRQALEAVKAKKASEQKET